MENAKNAKRESNLELMRIIMMILIIAHHYVVNSGITNMYNFSNITANMLFLECIGFAGKIMINCFVIITGYFMINKKITLKKILKLYLEVKFYHIIIYLLLLILGIEQLGIKNILKTLFNIVYNVNIGFTGTFFLLYLLIPFINILINNLNKKQFSILLGIAIFYFTIISTFSIFNNTFNEITWYIIVYMIGAFIKLYPNKFDNSKKIWIFATIISIIFSLGSIMFVNIINNKFNKTLHPYFFVTDAHKILAVTTSIALFMMFKNIRIKYSAFINNIASTTFGVLLIHANSDAMIRFVWQDIFAVKEQYFSPNLYIHAICTVILVYVVCVCIDLLRIKFIEKPFFKYLENNNLFMKANNFFEKILYNEDINNKEESYV